jgi:hypothetical protein
MAFSAAARGQVVPEATGPGGPLVSGIVNYDVHYTQTAQLYGGPQGNLQRSVLSGDLRYSSPSENHPFNVTYTGGDMWTLSGYTTGNGVFQHMLVSQGFEGRDWGVNLSDDVSYLPQAPTGGFSGIPGIGSIPGLPEPPDQPILTLNTRSVHNIANANFEHNLNYASSLSMSGGYTILRFPDGEGLDSNSYDVAPQYTYRLNPLNSLTASYAFSQFGYPGSSFTMTTQATTFGLSRVWNRELKTTVSAGPEWTGSSEAYVLPLTTGLRVSAQALYALRSTSANLTYTQSTTSGSIGTLLATHNNDASVGLTRNFGRNFNLGFTGSYMRTQQLLQPGVVNAQFGGVTATERIGEYITISGSYTAIHQLSSLALPTNAISGLSQVFSFSVGYSPRERHLKK